MKQTHSSPSAARAVAPSFLASVALAALAPALFASCSSAPTHAGHYARPSVGSRGRLEYDSSQLLIKSSDQVNELIQKRVDRAAKAQAMQTVDDDDGIRTEPDAVAYLRDAMRIALSRPDQDGFRSAAFSRLDRDLSDLNSLAPVLQQLTDESIGALQSEEAATNVKATYIFILNNMMAEIRPWIRTRPWAKVMIEHVRDADIEISDAVKSQQFMRSMTRPVSPSKVAESILK